MKEIKYFSEAQIIEFENDFLQMDKKSQLEIQLDDEIESVISQMNELQLSCSEIQSQNLIDLCKETVLTTIRGQFGIAGALLGSKDGGNVTTLHNAKNQVFANDNDKQKYNRDYNSSAYHGENKKYVEMKAELDRLSDSGELTDIYTYKDISGKQFIVKTDGTIRQQYRYDVEHKESGNEIHNDERAKLFLTEEQSADLANSDINLGATAASINRSKKDKPLKEWAEEQSKFDPTKTNAEYFEINTEEAYKNDEAARKFINRELVKAEIKQYSTELVKTGAKDSAKMAAYSAISVVLYDFTSAIIDELKFMLSNKKDKNFSELFAHFKNRMTEVMKDLKMKWKDIFIGSFEQGLMAFFSNILVFVINVFATTLKKLVSLIRAGFVSLCQAVKIIIKKPDNMTQSEANFEATKVLTAGIIQSLSIGLSVAIEGALLQIPGLAPLMTFPIPSFGKEQRTVSDVLAVTLSTLAGSLVTTVVLYFMDSINNRAKKDKIQIQLLAQGGVLVSLETMKTWLCLDNAYNYFIESVNQMSEDFDSIHTEMNKFSLQMNEAAKETDDIMEKLRNYNNNLIK